MGRERAARRAAAAAAAAVAGGVLVLGAVTALLLSGDSGTRPRALRAAAGNARGTLAALTVSPGEGGGGGELGRVAALEARVASLERDLRHAGDLLRAHTGWALDPFASAVTARCANHSTLHKEHCWAQGQGLARHAQMCELIPFIGPPAFGNYTGGGAYDHHMCFEGKFWRHGAYDQPRLPPSAQAHGRVARGLKAECVVYDFGIRQQPQFGEAMAATFGGRCEVHAFDPSPVTLKWIDKSGLKDNPNYHFHAVGASGWDGSMEVQAYNWDQVSLVRAPIHFECDVLGLEAGTGVDGSPPRFVTRKASNLAFLDKKGCKMEFPKKPPFGKELMVPVKTLPTIMAELGHSFIDVLKLDVEGSEYLFLAHALDHYRARGERLPFDQLTIELHHFTLDPRYGDGASPEVSELVRMLQLEGFECYFNGKKDGGWPGAEPAKPGMGYARYMLLNFVRTGRASRGRPAQRLERDFVVNDWEWVHRP